MTPPLVIDRTPIVRARIVKHRQAIYRCRFPEAVEQVVSSARADEEIPPAAIEDIERLAQNQIEAIREGRVKR